MITVETVAAKKSPPPAAKPTAATAQMLAAVVRPRTTWPRSRIAAGAQEADPRHHLGGDPRRVEDHVGSWDHPLEAVGRDDINRQGPTLTSMWVRMPGGPSSSLASKPSRCRARPRRPGVR